MKYNKNLQRLAEPGVRMHLFFLVAFAVATLLFKMYYLAAAEGAVIIFLIIYSLLSRRRKEKQLAAYIESVTYDTENAKNNTLMKFPLPIAVFRLDDSRIIWGNDQFFAMCGATGTRLDASIADMVPQFSGKWLLEGKSQYPALLQVGGRKYQLHGNVIRSEKPGDDGAVTGITYWVDVTEYDDVRVEYERSRPVPGIVVIDNLDELTRNQPDRVKNDLRDAVEDRLRQWCDGYNGILRRYDRDRYLVIFEKRDVDKMKQDKFRITEDMHQVENTNGIDASISIGLGEDAESLGEGLQFADMGIELALSRGGDQTVVKNRLSFEFYGGRGFEVEKRTKVKSRVMANTLAELVRDSSRVIVMGHRFADLDSVGAAVGVCCLARKCGVKVNVAIDLNNNAARLLLERMRREPEYKDVFISPAEAIARADGHALLVVVDTNRPDMVENPQLLESCNRVAVIDHHRRAATYIENAAFNFHEPYASSASELVTELLQYLVEPTDLLREEAGALLAGIVLDTKHFTQRTGGRTFEAAAFLRRSGADTAEVQRLFQGDLKDMVTKYDIIRRAEMYRSNIAVSVVEEPGVDRVAAAQAADDLLTLKGVQASFVIYAAEGAVLMSARSLGEINVQVILEALGGGGNSTTAGARIEDTDPESVRQQLIGVLDAYFEK